MTSLAEIAAAMPGSASGYVDRVFGRFVREHKLTETEARIVRRLVHGHSTRSELAGDLGISEKTVKKHARAICQKTSQRELRDVVVALLRLALVNAAERVTEVMV